VTAPAAAIRAGVQRGDPLALQTLLTVSEAFRTSNGILVSHLAPDTTGTDEPVAIDAGDFAAGEVGELLPSAGEDAGLMEHERQARLARWQRQP
jgi:hypothetical protein